MEIIKIHNLKTAKQLIESGFLDIYEHLYKAYIDNNRKIFDLLIITYYKSIDFNKIIYGNTIINYMFALKSKYLNFILNNVELNSNNKFDSIYICSYKSFKILINILFTKKNLKFDLEYVFGMLCLNRSLRFIKLLVSKYNIKDLILKKNLYGYTALDHAYSNKSNIVEYLLNYIKT